MFLMKMRKKITKTELQLSQEPEIWYINLKTGSTSMFRCGIGRVKELGSVKESFKEAVVALRESISHVVHIEDVPAAQKYDGEYPRDLEIRYHKRRH